MISKYPDQHNLLSVILFLLIREGDCTEVDLKINKFQKVPCSLEIMFRYIFIIILYLIIFRC